MADPRQIIELPVATVADDTDLLLMRQGLFDKQVEVDLIREPLLRIANNLSDLDNPATARTNLGVAAVTDVAYVNATNDFNFNIQQEAQLRQYSVTAAVLGNVSGATALNLNNGNVFTATVTGNVTFSFTNPAASGQTSYLTLVLTNGGAFTTTLPGSIVWADGSAPALQVAGVDVLRFATTDNGTTWYDLRTPAATAANVALLDATNDFNFEIQQEAQLRHYSLTRHAVGNITGAASFDLTNGNVQTATVTGIVTVSFTNPAASGQASTLTVILTNGGAFAVTWPASVDWSNGVAPTLTASGVDILTFVTHDGGTTWYGVLSGENFS